MDIFYFVLYAQNLSLIWNHLSQNSVKYNKADVFSALVACPIWTVLTGKLGNLANNKEMHPE